MSVLVVKCDSPINFFRDLYNESTTVAWVIPHAEIPYIRYKGVEFRVVQKS